MNQLDRIEAKLTRLLEIAEVLLAKSEGQLQGNLAAAEAAKTLQALKEELAPGKSIASEAESPVIDAEQSIKDLFIKYPAFKEDFFKLDEELAGLKGPLGASILKESTIGMIAKSLRIDTEGFVKKVNDVLAGY